MPPQLQVHSLAELWHPWVLAWIVLMQVAYLLLTGPIRIGFGLGGPVPVQRKLWFSLGLWMVYLSEGTPLHILSEHYLFSAHMVQHLLLTMVVPPLLLSGLPDWSLRPLIRLRLIRSALYRLTRPVPALLLFNVIYSVWHMPAAYQAALWSHGFHMFQHGALFLTAILMWWPMVGNLPEIPRLHEGAGLIYMFVVGISQSAVYAMITFADGPIYRFYEQAPRVWPISPLADQQSAGIIMNVGGMLISIVVWMVLFFRWAAREAPDLAPHVAVHSQGQPAPPHPVQGSDREVVT